MKKLHSVSAALLVLVSALVLASCGGTDPYPEDWSPITAVEKGDCSPFVGTFQNGYSRSSDDPPTMEGGLIALLIGSPTPAEAEGAQPVTRVSIEQPSADRLVLTGFNGPRFVRQGERLLARGSCSKKGLPISGKFSGTNAENVLGFVSVSGRLQRAENSDLVARMRMTFTGIALLVPVSISHTSWFRFERIDPEPMPSDPVQ